jgi:hypothetical protein
MQVNVLVLKMATSMLQQTNGRELCTEGEFAHRRAAVLQAMRTGLEPVVQRQVPQCTE